MNGSGHSPAPAQPSQTAARLAQVAPPAHAAHQALTAVKAWLAELPPTVVTPPDSTTQLFNDLKACVSGLHQLRFQLLDAAEDLRLARQAEETARAIAEQTAVAQAGGDDKTLGPKEAASKRSLTLALAADADYQAALRHLNDVQYQHDLAQAEVLHQLDMQAAVRITIRLAIATAALNPDVAQALAS